MKKVYTTLSSLYEEGNLTLLGSCYDAELRKFQLSQYYMVQIRKYDTEKV